jgi:hypothetical protein
LLLLLAAAALLLLPLLLLLLPLLAAAGTAACLLPVLLDGLLPLSLLMPLLPVLLAVPLLAWRSCCALQTGNHAAAYKPQLSLLNTQRKALPLLQARRLQLSLQQLNTYVPMQPTT